MSDLFAFGAARGATRLLFLGAPPVAASVARSTPRGLLRLVVERRPHVTPPPPPEGGLVVLPPPGLSLVWSRV